MSDVLFSFMLFFAAALLTYFTWSGRRAEALLQQWAVDHAYKIIERHRARFFQGPFFWTTAKGQVVFRVVVQDMRGQRRTGWVRCGSWLLGLLADKVEARWDDGL
jgi:acetamidase/formamidase